jgi:hypothetical protein
MQLQLAYLFPLNYLRLKNNNHKKPFNSNADGLVKGNSQHVSAIMGF